MRKFLILISLFLGTLNINGQEFTNKEEKRLSKIGIEISDIDSIGKQLNNDLDKILSLERKRKSNKTSGIILTSLSAFSLGLGTAIIATPVDSDGHEMAFRNLAGGIFIASGAIEGGIGIPLLFVSKRKRKQRDLLLSKYSN